MNMFRAAAAMLLFLAPGAALADPVTFTTTGSSATYGASGNALTFGAAGSTLKLKVTGWQLNQATGAMTEAYLGGYAGGLGVTGAGDLLGFNNLHQIDNLGGFTDLVLLQFNRPVPLAGIGGTLYQLPGITGLHGDFAVASAGAFTPMAWNGSVDLTGARGAGFAWTEVTGPTAAGSKAVVTTGGSQLWLLSASQLSRNLNDGFKLAAVTVNEAPAVPEPATWAMLILGVGCVGYAQRRRPQARRLGAA